MQSKPGLQLKQKKPGVFHTRRKSEKSNQHSTQVSTMTALHTEFAREGTGRHGGAPSPLLRSSVRAQHRLVERVRRVVVHVAGGTALALRASRPLSPT